MNINLTRIVPDHFRKPEFICQSQPELENVRSPQSVKKFIEGRKAEIEKSLGGFRLTIRYARIDEASLIKKMIDTYFSKKAAAHIGKYDVFRFIRFGYTLVVEDENRKIIACKLAIGFDSVSGISHSFVSLVVPEWTGKQIAFFISTYSCLVALERGSLIQRATVNPLNFASVKSLVNKVGFVCQDFHPEFFGKDEPRYVLYIPLSPAGLTNNTINEEKARLFIASHEAGKDYRLLPAVDLDAITKMYSETEFRIVSLISHISGEHQMLALPKYLMNFSPSEEVFFQCGPGDE